MKKTIVVGSLVFLLSGSLALAKQKNFPILTGATFFLSDSSGNFVSGDRWNTLSTGDWSRAWFACSISQNKKKILSSTFVNGPDLSNVPLALKLKPGIYNFTVFLNDGTPITYHGMNLYFGTGTTNPAISVYTQDQTDLNFLPPYFGNSGQTLALDPYTSDGATIPGSNNLIYSNGSYTVKLTNFMFTSQYLYNVDRVSSFATAPDGQIEKIARITLEVRKIGSNKILKNKCP